MTGTDETRDPATRDPRKLRGEAPLLDAWLTVTAQAQAGQLTPMSVPGHKQRLDLTGAVTAGDAPLYGGLDTIKHADYLLAEGERLAAQLWAADWCRFSVAGSTHGNQALALAVGQPGQPIVVTRALHRSLLLGIVLAGLEPVWVLPEVDPATGLPGPVPVAAVEAALAAPPGRLRGVPRRPVLRRHYRRPVRAGRRGAPGRGTAAGGRGLGRASRFPSGPAAARAGRGRGRHGDQRAQGAARVHPGRAGAGAHQSGGQRPAGRRPAEPGLRRHAHHQPGGRDHGQHRRGAGAAGPGRDGAVWPAAPRGGRGQAATPRGTRPGRAGRAGCRAAPSWWCCWPAPGCTGTRWRRT